MAVSPSSVHKTAYVDQPMSQAVNTARMVYSNMSVNGMGYQLPATVLPSLQQCAPSTGEANLENNMMNVNSAVRLGADVLLSAEDFDQELGVWTHPSQPNHFEMVLPKGSLGLGIGVEITPHGVVVKGFHRSPRGEMGPAEISGRILPGDIIVAVDGMMLSSKAQVANAMSILQSPYPVRLRFLRPSGPPARRESNQRNIYDQAPSIQQLNHPKLFSRGTAHHGVRYIGPDRWSAEFALPHGGVNRLGEFPTEELAAEAFNNALYAQLGDRGVPLMNRAAAYPGVPVQQPPPAAPPAQPNQLIHFASIQKNQLRAQIMAFKFLCNMQQVPHNVLVAAVNMNDQDSRQLLMARMARQRRFRQPAAAGPSAKRTSQGRSRRRRRNDSSEEEEEDDETTTSDDSDEDFTKPANVGTNTAPSRRSARNLGREKKRYRDEDNDEDLLVSGDEEKPKQPVKPVKKGPEVEKIVGVRYFAEDENDDDPELQFYAKWKNKSYWHLQWMTTDELEELGRTTIQRMRRYLQQNSHEVDAARENVVIKGLEEKHKIEYFNEIFLEVDRILDVRFAGEGEEKEKTEKDETIKTEESSSKKKQVVDMEKESSREKEYLIKWTGLSYADCTWESEKLIKDDRKIAEFHRFNHPPMVAGAHPAMLTDVRPSASEWAKYQNSQKYSNGNELRSYQLESLNWMIFCWYNRRNCILADEMGLGKTIQAMSVLEHLRQREHIRGPFLVIAPLATLANWKREFESWTTMNCVVYHDSEGGEKTREFIRQHEFYFKEEGDYYKRRGVFKFNVLVTSYNIVLSDAELFESIKWRYVVVDEAHKLKNRESKILQVMQNFRWDACLLMTGTPLQNGVYELWSLLNFIEPEKFPSQQDFYDRFGDLNTAEQVAGLHDELRPYMLRRVKEDVEKSIPPKEETIIDVELTNLQKKYYRAIFERNRNFLAGGFDEGGKKSTGPVASLVNIEMELRKCCNHPFLIRGVEDKECRNQPYNSPDRMKTVIQASGKTVLLDKMMAKFRQEKKKMLIFSQFKMMLDVLEDMISLRGYKYERMDGNVRGNERQAAIDRFNDMESDTFVFLLSTRAGGVGINLISASVVVLFDSDWNPQNDLQAVARCHRIGQTKKVQIYRLVTKKTYEAQMFEIASKKLGMHHAVFETGGVRSGFTGEETGGNGMMSLLSLDREKVEMMIRYGAYAIMEEDEEDPENKKMNSVDIDELLSNSRTIRYEQDKDKNGEGGDDGKDESKVQVIDPTSHGKSSALSFSKATFIAETSDSTIDFNDDQFWEKVLGPKKIQQLLEKVEDGFLSKATVEELKEFLIELRYLSRAVVLERQKGKAFQDAEQVLSILVELKVVGPVKPQINVREVAGEWLKVIERPKRRRTQEATSELMYLPFLDGEKEKKKRGGGGKRKKKIQISSESEPDDDEDEGEEFSADEEEFSTSKRKTPSKRKKQSKSKRAASLKKKKKTKTKAKSKTKTIVYGKASGIRVHVSCLSRKKNQYRVVSITSDKARIQKQLDKRIGDLSTNGDGDFWCCVCYSSEAYSDDPIVQCETCQISVHQYCYGIQSIPKGDTPWYCDVCDADEDQPVSCAICPLQRKGAFKHTDDGDEWAHVVCGLWIPQVKFGDVEKMDLIQNTTQAREELKDTVCIVCNEKGSCITCHEESCTACFHPICGRETKYRMFMNDEGRLIAYCPKHNGDQEDQDEDYQADETDETEDQKDEEEMEIDEGQSPNGQQQEDEEEDEVEEKQAEDQTPIKPPVEDQQVEQVKPLVVEQEEQAEDQNRTEKQLVQTETVHQVEDPNRNVQQEQIEGQSTQYHQEAYPVVQQQQQQEQIEQYHQEAYPIVQQQQHEQYHQEAYPIVQQQQDE